MKCAADNKTVYRRKHRNENIGITDLSAYRRVLSVCSQQLRPGDIIAIYTWHVQSRHYHGDAGKTFTHCHRKE